VVPVLDGCRLEADAEIPERHLGLRTAAEGIGVSLPALTRLGNRLDLDQLLNATSYNQRFESAHTHNAKPKYEGVRVGVARESGVFVSTTRTISISSGSACGNRGVQPTQRPSAARKSSRSLFRWRVPRATRCSPQRQWPPAQRRPSICGKGQAYLRRVWRVDVLGRRIDNARRARLFHGRPSFPSPSR